jgi:hypothetical protein
VPDKLYDALDVDWLQARATEIVAHDRFDEFEQLCHPAAQVLRERRGRIYGLSLDAAVTEFDRFLAVEQ